MTSYTITPATPFDAHFIGHTVMQAIGNELCEELCGGADRLPLVEEMFTRLAIRDDSQYSWRNSHIARDENGRPVGCIVAYDGYRLRQLRHAFATEANNVLGWSISEDEIDAWDDECQPDEFYIDSLYVAPARRGEGIGSALIRSMIEPARQVDKPLGLLCEPSNTRAFALYTDLGFTPVGTSRFFATPMHHLRRSL